MPLDRTDQLKALMAERILMLDGAMGTMIQRHKLDEADYRGERFADWHTDLKGNNDLLASPSPRSSAASMSSIWRPARTSSRPTPSTAPACPWPTTTCRSWRTKSISPPPVWPREAADKYSTPDKPRFVAGVLGPTNRTASISPDVNDPGHRNISFGNWSRPTTKSTVP